MHPSCALQQTPFLIPQNYSKVLVKIPELGQITWRIVLTVSIFPERDSAAATW